MNVNLKPDVAICPFCATAKTKKPKPVLIVTGDINMTVCEKHLMVIVQQQKAKE